MAMAVNEHGSDRTSPMSASTRCMDSRNTVLISVSRLRPAKISHEGRGVSTCTSAGDALEENKVHSSIEISPARLIFNSASVGKAPRFVANGDNDPIDPWRMTLSRSGSLLPAILVFFFFFFLPPPPSFSYVLLDLVELLVFTGGTMRGITFVQDGTTLATLPDVNVSAGQLMVTRLGPATATTELTTQGACTDVECYGGAWDVKGSAASRTRGTRWPSSLPVAPCKTPPRSPTSPRHPRASSPCSTRYDLQGNWSPSSCGGKLVHGRELPERELRVGRLDRRRHHTGVPVGAAPLEHRHQHEG